MAPAVERREHPRRSLSGSPTNRGRRSPRRRSPSRRERSPVIRSPVRTSSSHRPRSPSKQKQSDRARSPRHTSSRSPSPRTKRLRRAQAGREEEKSVEGERRRNSSREEREDKDARRDRKGDGERSSRRGRSISPEEHGRRGRHGSRSPSRAAKGRTRDEDVEARAAVSSRDDDPDSLAKMNAAAEALEAKEKQKPSFELSGKLAEETNRVRGVTLLFTEPPEARKPDVRWRLYVFKAGEVLNDPLYVHRQSCYLFGRERRVADVPTDHPSCSKQHAVLQFRVVEKEQPDGLMSKQVRPYVMDLDSTNGTFINDNRIEPRRYYELFEKDTIKFGNSSREYVLLHENSMG